MVSKRGQGLSTNAIILIILGVVVLVVLIAGFTLGWGALKDRLTGGSNNVDTIAQACSTSCATNSVYDYCDVERELKFKGTLGNLKSGEKYTCDLLSDVSGSHVEKCPGIQPCSSTSAGEKEYVWVTAINECIAEGEAMVTNSKCDQNAKGTGDNICCERSK